MNSTGMVGNASAPAISSKRSRIESRLLILCILAEGEKSVSELEDILNLRQPTVSQQLARLRADGLVSTRRDGQVGLLHLASADARVIIRRDLRRVLQEAAQALVT